MTKFVSHIEVKVEGDIVRAKLFDGENIELIAMCRKTAIAAAMSLLEQMDPSSGAEIVPMLKRAAGG